MNNVKVFALIVFFLWMKYGISQGCSDAGFCTIDGINPNQHIDTVQHKNQQLSIGLNYGLAQFGVKILSPSLAYKYIASESLSVSFRLNYAVINGSLGSNNGLSDLFTSFTYKVNQRFTIINGIKTPLSTSNEKNANRAMPHSYQTSLGTVDYLAGLSWNKDNWLISVGGQIPLYQNANTFMISNFDDAELNANYASTNKFERKPDLVLRVNYKVPNKLQKLGLTIGLLPIYHVANDTYIGADGIRTEIDGSKGVTLNVSGIVRYKLSDFENFEFTFGSPVIARSTRPDGLVQMAVNFQYNKSFGR